MRHIKPLGSQGQNGKIQNPKTQKPNPQCHFQNFALRWYVIPFTTIIPLEAQKATLPKEESSKTLGQIRSSPSEFSSRHINYRSYSSLYLEGAFVDTKKVTLPPQHQKQHEAAFYHKQANVALSIRSCQNQTETT